MSSLLPVLAMLRSSRKAAVSLLFATALIPLLMMVGLAVDYGMYSQAEAQLDMAADAAAIHAARIAAQLLQQNDPAFLGKGELAGHAWFLAQLGNLAQAQQSTPSVTVQVSVASGTSAVTAKVNYTDIITAHFGKLFPNTWPHWPNWGIAGNATAVISNASYVEVVMLLDNSSSMLIGASAKDISKIERLTPCSAQSGHEGQGIDEDYSWAYSAQKDGKWLWKPLSSTYSTTPAQNSSITLPYGFGSFIYPGSATPVQDVIPTKKRVGNCDERYTGASECIYPGAIPGVDPTTGACANNGGGAGSVANYATNSYVDPPAGFTPLQNTPQAPCAFACHNDTTGTGNDYWGLVQQHPDIDTRYSVLHAAAGRIISLMTKAPSPSQLSVGVYQFTEAGLQSATDQGVSQVYPTTGKEAGPVTGDGTTDPATVTATIQPPITDDRPDTNFENAMSVMDKTVTKAGTGTTASSPKKDLFIVTDGMDDYYVDNDINGQRVQRPISPAACTTLKNQGVKIYVLYTTYYPLPNPYYLDHDKQWTEAPAGETSPIEAAMNSCSSNDPNDPQNYFYEASDKGSINTALDAMLAAALGSAARLSD
jgi:Flp pilus assembly protein TadG